MFAQRHIPQQCCMLLNVAAFFWFVMAIAGSACTERDMLNLIGKFEGPRGYTDYYRGNKHPPPAPLTSMTVAEVLEWQRSIRTKTVSTAAGRYQFIYKTLDSLVRQGVAKPSDRFNARTQDKLARHLMREAGYRDGVSSERVANNLAGIWAALPRVSGAGAGLSHYHNVAGNKAAITAESYMQFLRCEASLDELESVSGNLAVSVSLADTIEDILEAFKTHSQDAVTLAADIALYLLFLLFGVDLIYRIGMAIKDNASIANLVDALWFQTLTVAFFLFIITQGGELIQALAEIGAALSDTLLDEPELRIGDIITQKLIYVFKIAKASETMGSLVAAAANLMSMLGLLSFGITICVILITYARIFLVASAGMIAAGFGSWQPAHSIARGYVMRLISFGLQLFMMSFVMVLFLGTSMAIDAEAAPVEASTMFFLIEFTLCVLLLVLPNSIGQLVQ
jgi:hypothetical protein